MAWVVYDNFKLKQLNGNGIDLDDPAVTLKIALVTNSYVPNTATHDFFDDVNANEVTGTNYTAGGNAIASKTVTLSAGVVTVDAADPATWVQSASGFANARYAILYQDTGGAASTDPLIAHHNFGTDVGNTAGDLTLQLAADGILTLT